MVLDDVKDFLKIFGTGAAFGASTLILSELSRATIGIPLGFNPINMKNFFKITV